MRHNHCADFNCGSDFRHGHGCGVLGWSNRHHPQPRAVDRFTTGLHRYRKSAQPKCTTPQIRWYSSALLPPGSGLVPRHRRYFRENGDWVRVGDIVRRDGDNFVFQLLILTLVKSVSGRSKRRNLRGLD